MGIGANVRSGGRAVVVVLAFMLWGFWWGLFDGLVGGLVVGLCALALVGAVIGAIAGAIVGMPLGVFAGLVLGVFTVYQQRRGTGVAAIAQRMPHVVTITVLAVAACLAIWAHDDLPGASHWFDLWGGAVLAGSLAAALVLGRLSARSIGRWYVARDLHPASSR